MPFVKKCCVATCNITNLVLHKFPNPNKDLERFRKWVEAISNSELNELNPIVIYSSKRVCHRHFEQDFVSYSSKRLQLNAVPKLYLDGEINEICSDQPSTSYNLIQDHNYSKSNQSIEDEPLNEAAEPEVQIESVKVDLLSPLQILKHSGISRQAITPKKKKLYSAIQKLNRKYVAERATKQGFKRRLFEAEQFQKNHQLEVNMGKLNNLAAMLIQCQFRESEKSKKLRRFTLNEKFLALTLYKQSAKSYSILSKIFILPSKSTLKRLLSKIVGGPGITDVVFDSLEELTSKMEPSEKYVAVLFDEMAIIPGLSFNEHHGIIEGFEDMGENMRDTHMTDHVLLFMVRGLKKQWKAPISYHFASRGGAKTHQIKDLLIKIINKLISIGLKPITVICDQNNQAAINSLIKDTREKYLRMNQSDQHRKGSFEIGDFKIYPILDPPHLLKGMRNNFINKNLFYESKKKQKIAKWEHVQKLYERDNISIDGLRVLPHITDEHIYPNKLRKMKVKHAAQIFSQRFAATLQLTCQIDTEKQIGDRVEETAELLYFFDRLFDSFNGSSKFPDRGKMLRCGLSDTSDHISFWNKEALPLLATMKFEKKSPKEQAVPPSLKNWTFVIQNIKCIWQILKADGFAYLLPRHLNQDPLENAFGQLRSFGASYTNPSASQFIGIFKTLFFNTHLSFYKKSFNCEDDKCETMFVSLQKLFNKDEIHDENVTTVDDILPYSDTSSSQSTNLSEKLRELSTSYVAGFILKKIKKIVTCTNCKSCLFSTTYTEEQNLLISRREYDGFMRRLCYPTPSFILCFSNIYKIIYFCLDEQPHSKFLIRHINNIVSSHVNFDFLACSIDEHKSNIIKLVLKFTIRTILHNWCMSINKIISGKSKFYTGANKTKLQANAINLNRKKKKDNKKAPSS